MDPRLLRIKDLEFTKQELPIKVDSVAVKLTKTILPILAVPLFVIIILE